MKTLKHMIVLAAVSLGALAPVAFASGEHGDAHHGHDEAAIGQTGKASDAKRTITIEMSDAMRFSPAAVQVKQGETVRFVVKNTGKIKHEMVLGTEAELKEHYELMKKFPGMEHADPNMVTVHPGQTGEIVWKFTRAGTVSFACLQPGHYDAGMKGVVMVAQGKKTDGHTSHHH